MSEVPIQRLSSAATRSMHRRVVGIDRELISRKAEAARVNPRLREIHVFHDGDGDGLQRMLNALQPGSYVAPHRHRANPTAETIVLLRGGVGFVPFLDDGQPDEENLIHLSAERGVVGLDCRAGVWHTFFALEPDTVVLEVKTGPYDPATAKELAPWAIAEGRPGAGRYLAKIEDLFRARFGLVPRSWSPAD